MSKNKIFRLVLNCNNQLFDKLPSNVLLVEESVVSAETESQLLVGVTPYYLSLPKKFREKSFWTAKLKSPVRDSAVLPSSYRERLFSCPGFEFWVYLPVNGRDDLPPDFLSKKFSVGLVFAVELLSNRLRLSDLQKLVSESEDEIKKISSDESLSQQLADQNFERTQELVRSAGLLSSSKGGDD